MRPVIDDSLFASIIQQSGQGIMIHQNFQPLFVNQAFADLLAYPNPDHILTIKDIRCLFAKSDLAAIERFYQSCLDGKQSSWRYEFEVERADGQLIWLSNNSFRISINGEWALCDSFLDISEHKQIEQRNALLATVVEQMDDGVEITDDKVNIIYVNPAYERITGYALEETLGKTPAELLRPKGVDDMSYKAFEQSVIKHGSGRTQFVSQRKNGDQWISDTTVTAVEEKDGRVEKYVAIKRDITARERSEQELKRSEQHFRGLMEHAVDAIFVHDLEGRFIMVNQRACESLGYEQNELLQLSVQNIECGITGDSLLQLWEKLKLGPISIEGYHARKNGSQFPVELHIGKFDSANIELIIAIARDITKRKKNEQKLYKLAYFDSLTGLPNRKLGREKLVKTLAASKRNQRNGALLFIDLDDFKKVNDTMGHHVGDKFLKRFANQLVNCLRASDSVSRLGGDEFMVVAIDEQEDGNIDFLAQRIADLCQNPFKIKGREVYMSASIGISLFPQDSTDPNVLMRNADTAMYRAKSRGRSQFSYFDASMNELAVKNMRIETLLRQAQACAELSLYYQPLVDARTGQINGAEALLRWHSAILGEVSLETLIPIAEQTGLIHEIGFWVLKTACHQAKQWQQNLCSDFSISVNMSVFQLRAPGFINRLNMILKESQLLPRYLELELTESSFLDNTSVVQEAIAGIKSLGVKLAIDDFGTGYSSLNSLLHFHFDTLKIDRSFVRHITQQDKNFILIKAIISLAQSLKIRVIAEGVETFAQRSCLQAQGCDLLQGWLYSKALPPQEFKERFLVASD
ncbi:MAG: EAL domain-containing protein [Betaproteobacteria bacterium]|nr:EAL domain-containing protein [Betaproteobacteria bacterium]